MSYCIFNCYFELLFFLFYFVFILLFVTLSNDKNNKRNLKENYKAFLPLSFDISLIPQSVVDFSSLLRQQYYFEELLSLQITNLCKIINFFKSHIIYLEFKRDLRCVTSSQKVITFILNPSSIGISDYNQTIDQL